MAAMRLSSYRKLEPTRLEEIVLFDHPSGYTRVYDSMRWLKENPSAADELAANEPAAEKAAPR
jgi:STE24 endopeptidase